MAVSIKDPITGANGELVLGLDLGTKFAWCVTRDGVPREVDHKTYKKRRGEGAGVQWLWFAQVLIDLVKGIEDQHKAPIVLIAFERPLSRFWYAAEVLMAYRGKVEEYAEAIGIPYVAYSPGSIKKFATTKGNAGKDLMRECLIKKQIDCPISWRAKSIESMTEDEVDATWIALYGYDQVFGRKEELAKAERG